MNTSVVVSLLLSGGDLGLQSLLHFFYLGLLLAGRTAERRVNPPVEANAERRQYRDRRKPKKG